MWLYLFESVDETLVRDHSNESYQQYFHVVLFFVVDNFAK